MAMVIVTLTFLNTIISNIDKNLLNNIASGSNKTTSYMKTVMTMINSSLLHHPMHYSNNSANGLLEEPVE